MVAAPEQLQQLLSPPSQQAAQQHALAVLSTLPASLPPASLGPALASLLQQHHHASSDLSAELAASSQHVASLLATTKAQLGAILRRTSDLRVEHDALEDGLIDHRESLVSSLSQRAEGGGTLRERLEAVGQRREESKLVHHAFTILAKAEQFGLDALKAVEQQSLPQAFQGYVTMVDYISSIHAGAPTLALTAHLVHMASSVWNTLVKTLSARVVETLTAIGWPTPFQNNLDWEDPAVADFHSAFVDMLVLERLKLNHPLPSIKGAKATEPPEEVKPLLALQPLVQPLLLRFRWQFEGTRSTNRIDKPEYPLSHVLNLLSAHERFIEEDIQDLLDSNGFEDIDALTDFTSLLLPPLVARLKHHIPQLLELPPILAHTIYQTLDFDGVLHSRGYRPRGQKAEWRGLSDVILGRKEWFQKWLDGEREFFDSRYYAAISAVDAWQIVSEEDFDASESMTGVRPTKSALRVAEIVEQLTERYRPVPTPYTLPFLFTLHLPLLVSYSQRIASSLQAFESLSFGLLPGALGGGDGSRAATAGVGGLVRLVRAGVSARWMAEKCVEWGEDAFFLGLLSHLESSGTPEELASLAEPVLEASEGTLFDREHSSFSHLADRSEELVVRHVCREVLGEMKAYLGRRWDYDSDAHLASIHDLSLTPDLIAPLSLFSSLLHQLTTSFPSTLATTLYRRISTSLSATLYERLLVNRTWSEAGARQLSFDVEHGFLQAGREAGIRRGVGRGWELLQGGAKVMGLPSSSSASSGANGEGGGGGKGASFGAIMQLAFDDAVPESRVAEVLEDLGIPEVVARKEVLQAILRRRPECWR